MTAFGSELRRLREGAGLRQTDLALRLGVARSTLANLEADREKPSKRVWSLLCASLPEWVVPLTTAYELARATPAESKPSHPKPPLGNPAATAAERGRSGAGTTWLLGGPFVVERLTFVYLFGHSHSPSEILEVRRVRATHNGADGYGLKLVRDHNSVFEADEEALWGGQIEAREYVSAEHASIYLRRFRFDHTLRRGQVHEFATRYWVERDPDPGNAMSFELTIPAEHVSCHLHFRGPDRPRSYTVFGPLADDLLIPEDEPARGADPMPESGTASAYFTEPELGSVYGVAWHW